MMELSVLLAFMAAALILTITPGVDTVLVLRASVADGRRTAVMASLGVALGCVLWAAMVSLDAPWCVVC